MKQENLSRSLYHKRGGPLSIQYSKYQPSFVEDFIKAGIDLGLKRVDYNGETQVGVSKVQMTLNGPRRWSTSAAFLSPVESRPNLSIIKRAEVVRLIIDPKTKSAIGVEYKRNGSTHVVKAKKEVILSAGPFNSPKLLMLSGVGPKGHLQDLGIPLMADLPVGENLQDHTWTEVPVYLQSKEPLFPLFYDVESMLNYTINRNGPLTSTSVFSVFFVNTNKNITTDPPDVQIFTRASRTNASVLLIATSLLQPVSRGTVRLRSSDPSDPPLIDPKFLDCQEDRDTAMHSIEIVSRLIQTESFKKYSPRIHYEGVPFCSDRSVESFRGCLLKYQTSSHLHPVGTVKMGDLGDSTAALGPDLRVKGINQLRVVDSSVMPITVRGNTNAPTIMIAEKASDLIKKYHIN